MKIVAVVFAFILVFLITVFTVKGIMDATLALLSAMPNVIITSHQAFLTDEALSNIAKVTYENMDAYFEGKELVNEVKYSHNG